MRTLSRAQHVVSTVICWCSHASTGGDFGAKPVISSQRSGAMTSFPIVMVMPSGLYGVGALQPAYEAYRIPVSSTQQWFAVAERVFPVLCKAWVPECLRDIIVAGRGRKSSAALVADWRKSLIHTRAVAMRSTFDPAEHESR